MVARPATHRHGMALMLVLALAMVLGAFGYILSKLSSSARRELDVLSAHMRGLSVADACYAEVISRLSETGWQNRWFQAGPDVKAAVDAARLGVGAVAAAARAATAATAP